MLMLSGIIISCSNGGNNDEGPDTKSAESSSLILGKWKLDKIITAGFIGEPKTFDHSQNNVVYEFKPNNLLAVSGEIKDIDDYIGFPPFGNHFYDLIEEWFVDYDGTSVSGLKIDSLEFFYTISSKELIIDRRQLDGNAHYLSKTQ